jgi:hypothetical protein
MQKMTLTKLRSDLFQVADRILASGETVEIERNGRTLVLTAKEKSSKLARLSKRQLINGDAESLVELKVGTWQEPENLG